MLTLYILQSLIEPTDIGDFSLLPGDIIAMSDMSDGHLRFGRLGQTSLGIEWTIQWFSTLQLPQVSEISSYQQITFFPFPQHKPNESLPAGASSKPQLIFSPQNGLLTIVLNVYDGRNEEFYLLTIHLDSLMRCAGAFEDSTGMEIDGEVRRIPLLQGCRGSSVLIN